MTAFYQPIDNLLVNSAKAGQTVPVKWTLMENGVPVSDPASFVSVTTALGTGCTGVASDDIETYSGGSGLQYLGNGNWQFNWKTPTSYAGSCRTMTLTVWANSAHTAQLTATAKFQFK